MTDSTLRHFIDQCRAVWDCYQRNGPGRVPPEMATDVERIAAQLLVEPAALSANQIQDIETLRQLCDRCCRRSEGLCFVTGEAGLVPRRDLIAQFTDALAALNNEHG